MLDINFFSRRNRSLLMFELHSIVSGQIKRLGLTLPLHSNAQTFQDDTFHPIYLPINVNKAVFKKICGYII